MLRNKHLRLDQGKIRKRKVMRRILALRNSLGKMEEDPTVWVQAARKERGIL